MPDSIIPNHDNTVTIHIHGASRHGNPGIGGWGAFSQKGNKSKGRKGAEFMVTNIRMELVAAVTALQSIKAPSPVRLHTTCQYIVDGATQWLPGWKAKGWQKVSGEDVQHRDLWETIDHLAQTHRIEWVKAKAGDPGLVKAMALSAKALAEGLPT